MTSRFAKGLSFIEVLVSLLILTVGLVGIFNLHIVAKRSSFESLQQSQAAYFASDMLNRMRLNPAELANYAGDYQGTLSAPTVTCNTGLASLCSVSELRDWDRYQWEQQLFGSQELEGGKAVGGLDRPYACIDVQNNGEVMIVMTWYSRRATVDGGAGQEAFIEECGTKHDRRRVYSIKTVII